MNAKIILDRVKTLVSRWVTMPEYVYLVIASICVIGFALITPPFQGPDEEAHYIRAQYIAHGYLVPSNSMALPKSIESTTFLTFYSDELRGSSNNKYELSRTKDALKLPLNDGKTYTPAMVSYSPIPYLPAIPAIFISNQLNLSPLFSMYLARVSLGMAAVFLMFFAVRLIPHKKYLFAAVGLTPMLLFQQSVVTADSLSYSLLAIFIAYILYLHNLKNITKKQWIILGAISTGIVLAKPLVYIFLPLVLLLIKKRHGLRWIAGIALSCVIALAGWAALSSIVKSESVVAYGTPENISSEKQLDVLISEPKRALRIMWNSYMTSFGDDEVRGVIGIFGAADTIYPLWMVMSYAMILFMLYLVVIDPPIRKEPIKRVWKVLAAVLCTGYFIGVNLALYMSYTPVNFSIVYGLQGRYFLPILIVAAAMIFTGGVHVAKNDTMKVKWLAIISIIILLLLALLITFQRYYLFTP